MIARTYFYMSQRYGLRLSEAGAPSVRSLEQALPGGILGAPAQPAHRLRHGLGQPFRRPCRSAQLRQVIYRKR